MSAELKSLDTQNNSLTLDLWIEDLEEN